MRIGAEHSGEIEFYDTKELLIINHHRLSVFGASLFSLALLACTAAAADELMAPGAKVEQLADGFVFMEGPARDDQGNVYFTDIPNERIHKWSLDGKLSTFRKNSGRANGLFFDRSGNLLACEGGSRRVTTASEKTVHWPTGS